MLDSENVSANKIRVLAMVSTALTAQDSEFVHYLHGLSGVDAVAARAVALSWTSLCKQTVGICNTALQSISSLQANYLFESFNSTLFCT